MTLSPRRAETLADDEEHVPVAAAPARHHEPLHRPSGSFLVETMKVEGRRRGGCVPFGQGLHSLAPGVDVVAVVYDVKVGFICGEPGGGRSGGVDAPRPGVEGADGSDGVGEASGGASGRTCRRGGGGDPRLQIAKGAVLRPAHPRSLRRRGRVIHPRGAESNLQRRDVSR